MSDLSFLEESFCVSEMSDDVIDQISSISVIHDSRVESSRLGKVAISMGSFLSDSRSRDSERVEGIRSVSNRSREAVRFIIRSTSLVVESGRSISLIVGDFGSVGAVNRKLLVIHSESVSVGVRI